MLYYAGVICRPLICSYQLTFGISDRITEERICYSCHMRIPHLYTQWYCPVISIAYINTEKTRSLAKKYVCHLFDIPDISITSTFSC